MTGFQVAVVLMCAAINVIDGFDILAIAFSAPSLAREWGLGPERLGLVLSAGLVGMTVGALVFSPLADVIGRRPVILLCLALMSAGMLVAAGSQGVWILALGRIVTGLGIGGMTSCGGALAMEFSSARRRALSVGVVVIGYPLGATVGGVIAVHLLEVFGWRAIFLFGGALSLVLLPVLAVVLPESIVFLLDRRPRDALRRVNACFGRLGLRPLAALPVVAQRAERRGFGELLGLALAGRTAALCLAYALYMFSFYFILNWATKLVTEQGLSDRAGVSVSILINLGGMAGGLVLGYLATRLPLRWVVLTVVSLMAGGIALFGRIPPDLTLLGWTAAGLGFLMFGASATVYSVFALAYPPRIRITGIGLVVTAGRLGSIFGPIAGGSLLGAGLSHASLCLVLALPALAAAAIFASVRQDGEAA